MCSVIYNPHIIYTTIPKQKRSVVEERHSQYLVVLLVLRSVGDKQHNIL